VKHKHGFQRLAANRRERHMSATALTMAGLPKWVLDLPCGAERFWELLARVPDRYLLAAD
jgi:hypothetical protein